MAGPDTSPTESTVARGRLSRAMRPHASRAQLLGALLCALLGFALVVQARQTQIQGLDQLRQADLVRLLDNVTNAEARAEQDVRSQQAIRDRLLSGSDSSEAAQQAAQERLDTLGLLAGTVPASGPGIELDIADPRRQVDASVLLDTLEELRDGGAEVIQIGDVRVVAATAFTDDADGVRVDGRLLTPPYRYKVIGEPQTLAKVLQIPGGVLDVLRSKGAQGRVTQAQAVRVDALRAAPRLSTLARPRAAPPDREDRLMADFEYPDQLRYTSEHEWVQPVGRTGAHRDHRLRPGRARRHRLRVAPGPGATSPPGPPSARSSRRRASATCTRRSAARWWRATRRWTPTPELVNTDPYGEGWMFEVEPARPGGRRGAADRGRSTASSSPDGAARRQVPSTCRRGLGLRIRPWTRRLAMTEPGAGTGQQGRSATAAPRGRGRTRRRPCTRRRPGGRRDARVGAVHGRGSAIDALPEGSRCSSSSAARTRAPLPAGRATRRPPAGTRAATSSWTT